MKKFIKILIGVIVAVAVIGGGFYIYASHAAASHLPGHVYEYNGTASSQKAYMTFAKSGDQVIVTSNKEKAIEASKSSSDFQKVYKAENKNGEWSYKADGSKLTIAKTQDSKVSLWQYNNVLALGSKLHSSSFTYQIANAGQGVVKQATNFTQIK
ncbi:hypothetical protein FP435_01135 [Lactobacillus sp. PV037]|uniref:hypothetical protein n=1 Tax=unclassified Lactobacillus TaxID=2620435 RepID=UPI00223EDEBB|nr:MULTISPECIES: hypothetical protein [unclassified Lactobacillus]QNQ82743.1 hypothetical protein FP433_06670 [Lactobacillus sp. PV012]QNQ83137.1 hypothetical protein FP435_01135 [Lactobacillus sp. PV037]